MDGGVTSERQATDEPAALRRSDGSSVYVVAGSTLYTSSEILAAEQLILTAAGRRDGHVTPAAAVEVALLESGAPVVATLSDWLRPRRRPRCCASR
jgi:hypothetical protein